MGNNFFAHDHGPIQDATGYPGDVQEDLNAEGATGEATRASGEAALAAGADMSYEEAHQGRGGRHAGARGCYFVPSV